LKGDCTLIRTFDQVMHNKDQLAIYEATPRFTLENLGTDVAEVACRSLPQGAHQGRIARAIASAIDPSVNARLVGCVCDGFFALLDPGGHHNLSQDTSPWSASTASVRFGSWRSRFKSLFLGGGRRSKYSFSSAGRESELLAEASKTT
jgi:hypothetical protein